LYIVLYSGCFNGRMRRAEGVVSSAAVDASYQQEVLIGRRHGNAVLNLNRSQETFGDLAEHNSFVFWPLC